MPSEIHVNDVGTKIVIIVYDGDDIVDLSAATGLTIQIKTPDGTVMMKVAELDTDGTDGAMRYYTLDGDFTVAGAYSIQGIVNIAGGTFHTDAQMFRVFNNL